MTSGHFQNGASHAVNDVGEWPSQTPKREINGSSHDPEHAMAEPIAVVGLSLKFPQEATSAESFWEMLYEGRCAMTEFPQDRFNIEAFYDCDSPGSGTLPLRGGHFLKEDLGAFDAAFFSVTPAEAAAMDPQQRIMLETSYRALENAGLTIDKCSGSKTSVYTATFTDDYKSILLQDPEQLPQYAATGLSGSMLANRISWFFDFRGPSMNLDSACSSSLSALHIACQDLQNGTSRMALVGGCNLVFHPNFMLIMSNMSFLSPDSRCWSFDHRANGYARGDGFGVVILKKLSDALKDGDTIRAVIRATGLNQDGRTTGGITQPSGEAQRSLIQDTFTKAKLEMGPVRFFEAHGTGTAIGDPTEAKAIGNSFRSFRSEEEPLFVGAVKSNIGHLEGGSGIAGLIKTILILERGLVLPNTGLEKINPMIDTRHLRICFPTQPTQWPDPGLRRACINSFGFGGSNAVVIVDDALHYLEQHRLDGHHRTLDLRLKRPTTFPKMNHNNAEGKARGAIGASESIRQTPKRRMRAVNGDRSSTQLASQSQYPAIPRVLIWSAADEAGIKNMLGTYSQFLKQRAPSVLDSSFDDLVYTLAAKRTLHAWRSYVVATSGSDLKSFEQSHSKPIRASSEPGSIAFVFTGQGAQYARMGNGLLAFAFFRDRFARLEQILHDLGCEWSLQKLLFDTASTVNNPEYSQTFSTALQVALVDLLGTFGVVPAAVVGHSSGEIAAAYCAGAISDKTAMKLAFHRGRLAARLSKSHQTPQAMLAVALSEDDVQPFLARLKDHVATIKVQIGCVNSPKSITLTGDRNQLELIDSWLKENQHLARKLPVDVAYHSTFMDAIKADYSESLRSLDREPCKDTSVPMISSVTGTIIPPSVLCDSEYWVKNLISQVKFSPAISLLCVQSGKAARKHLGARSRSLSGIKELVEIGPHSTLQRPLQEILANTGTEHRISYISALHRQKDAAKSILEAIGRLWALGHPVDMLEANDLGDKQRAVMTDLPEYPFNHSQKHWFEDRTSAAFRFRSHARHELLGSLIASSNSFEARWRNFISSEKLQWLQDHQISGECLLPGAAMLAMAIEGVKQLSACDNKMTEFDLRDIYFLNALQVPDSSEGIETQVSLSTTKNRAAGRAPWYNFRVLSFSSEWVEHCRGKIRAECERQTDNDGPEKVSSTPTSAYHQELSSVIEACNEEASTEQLYNVIRDNGVNYGPTFRTLDRVRFSKTGAAVADIRAFPSSSRDRSKNLDVEAYTIHPSALDGLLQMVFPALNMGGARDLPTMVPSYIRKLLVYTNNNLFSPGSHLLASTRSNFKGYRGTESTVIAVLPGSNELFSVMEGYQTTFVSYSGALPRLDAIERPLLSHLEWLPDIALLTNEQIAQLCEQARPKDDSSVHFYRRLSLLIRYYITVTLEALRQLPLEAIAPHIIQYIKWMGQQLRHFNNEEPSTFHTEWLKIHESVEYRTGLEKATETANNIGKFYVTIGRSVLHLILGATDPQDLVSGGELVNAYFDDQFASQHLLKPFEVFLSNLAHKNPLMKVLEIGANGGNAALTCANILSAHGHPQWLRYDYTEISSDLLVKAQEKLVGFGHRIHFQMLDIAIGPATQGFEEFSYDLVIAAHVLHMTSDLTQALRNIRRLLKPGGKLVLFGITVQHHVRTDFAFGLLPGWWSATSPDSAGSFSPYRSEADLSKSLTDNGFTGIDFSIWDFEDFECHETSILVTTASDQTDPEALKFPEVAIVIDASSVAQLTFAKRLKEQLETVSKCQAIIYGFAEAVSNRAISGSFCVFLVEYNDSFLTTLSRDDFDLLKGALSLTKDMVWVVRDTYKPCRPDFHLIDGLSRVLRSENAKLRFIRLTINDDYQTGLDGPTAVSSVIKHALQSSLDDMEPEYEERDGMLYINRVIQSQRMNRLIGANIASHQERTLQLDDDVPLKATLKQPGVLSSIVYEEVTDMDELLESDEVVIEVRAAGVTSRDHQIASGQLNDKRIFSECSGVIKKAGPESGFAPGDKVFVSCPGACRTLLKCRALFAACFPPSMSFFDAAALPTSTLISYHALVNAANLLEGEVVLIHHAAGAVGQAAIQIAQHIGAKVIATTSTEEKTEILRTTYNLPFHNILSSKNPHLVQSILQVTAYHGVDVVLNFEPGDDFDSSLEALAPFGRLIDLGLATDAVSAKVTRRAASKCITYTALDLCEMQRQRPLLLQKLFKQTSSLIRSGIVQPAKPLKVFQAYDLEHALQSFQNGQNMGKVVIDLSPKQSVTALVANKPSYHFDPNATYVIAGGFGGLGRSVSRWMVDRGARNLIILSRTGARSDSAKKLVAEVSALGARVEAPVCDIIQADSLKKVLAECTQTLPPIRGCIQCTMVLRDAIFDNMSYDDFITGTRPKVVGSWNLHSVLPNGMDFFVLLSSIGGILGATSQANYSAGNTYKDALARYRTTMGEKSVSIDLGMMVSEGVVAETEGMLDSLRRMGYFMEITQAEFLALLDYYCDPALPLLPPSESQIIVGIEHPAAMEAKGLETPHWMQRPLFRHFRLIGGGGGNVAVSDNQKQMTDFATVLKQCVSVEAAGEQVTDWLVTKLSQILGTPAGDMDVQKPVHANGVNSLAAVELQNWFGKKIGADVAVFDILGNMSMVDLTKYAVGRSRFKP